MLNKRTSGSITNVHGAHELYIIASRESVLQRNGFIISKNKHISNKAFSESAIIAIWKRDRDRIDQCQILSTIMFTTSSYLLNKWCNQSCCCFFICKCEWKTNLVLNIISIWIESMAIPVIQHLVLDDASM